MVDFLYPQIYNNTDKHYTLGLLLPFETIRELEDEVEFAFAQAHTEKDNKNG